MRPLPELLLLPLKDLTSKEKAYVQRYKDLRRVRHSGGFIYHSRKLPKESDGQPDTN